MTTVSLNQAANLIASQPLNRYCLISAPGQGKSSIIKELASRFPTHKPVYIDVPNLELGSLGMPVIDHETQTTKNYPYDWTGFSRTNPRPLIIMLDEFSKGTNAVKNMLHTLLEAHNPRLMDLPLPEGSIVFLTGNYSSMGVGDTLKAHTNNRIIQLYVRPPTADEWIDWGSNNGVHPLVLAWVKEFQHCMASFLDGGQDNNPYIYNPKNPNQTAFVSPRSLERASNTIKTRDGDDQALQAALEGTLGTAAGVDMMSYISLQDKIPSFKEVIENPKTAPVPSISGAKFVFIYSAAQQADADNLDSLLSYLTRYEVEYQMVFVITLARIKAKQKMVLENKKFAKLVHDYVDIL